MFALAVFFFCRIRQNSYWIHRFCFRSAVAEPFRLPFLVRGSESHCRSAAADMSDLCRSAAFRSCTMADFWILLGSGADPQCFRIRSCSSMRFSSAVRGSAVHCMSEVADMSELRGSAAVCSCRVVYLSDRPQFVCGSARFCFRSADMDQVRYSLYADLRLPVDRQQQICRIYADPQLFALVRWLMFGSPQVRCGSAVDSDPQLRIHPISMCSMRICSFWRFSSRGHVGRTRIRGFFTSDIYEAVGPNLSEERSTFLG
jgi:hypothetical protein